MACELGLTAGDGQQQQVDSMAPPATAQHGGSFAFDMMRSSSNCWLKVAIGPDISPSLPSLQPPCVPYASLLFQHVTMNIYPSKAADMLRKQPSDGTQLDGKEELQQQRPSKLGQGGQTGLIARCVNMCSEQIS